MARRSVLFTPGDRPELLRKATRTDADAVVFDLEDAVSPTRKAAAREAVAETLTDPAFDPDCEVLVRVNPAGLGLEDDLDGAFGATDAGTRRLDGVVLPKVDGAGAVEALADGLADRSIDVPVVAVVESASGVLAAPSIAAADPTDALVFGAEDLTADLGATRTREGTEVLYARERVVLAATAAGVDAIDTLVTDYEDADHLREDAARSVRLGYDGKLAIHPDQVPVINEAFAPTDEAVEWATAVMAARAEAGESGVFEVDGEMIDAPLIARAERILDRAATGGEVDDPAE